MSHIIHIQPYFGTLCGVTVGLLAIVIWMVRFEPHGGVELSRYLFPLSALILERRYPAQSIPVPHWYDGALLQWVVLGMIVDLLCRTFRRESGHGHAA